MEEQAFLDIAALIEKTSSFLENPVAKGPKYSNRLSAMYQLMSNSNESFVNPAIHLWQPDRDTLMAAMVEWEPESTSESYWIAVHGHKPHEMCGGKSKWTQLCHMAFYKPSGVETESFNKKWNYLYGTENYNQVPAQPTRPTDGNSDFLGEGRIRSGEVDFVAGIDFR